MEKQYELIKLNNEPYDFLVIATSSISPLNYLKRIASKTGEKSFSVLFDLTLINGTDSNRYIKGECINGNFTQSGFKVIPKVDEKIRDICKSFFIENDEIVQGSTIPRQLKFLIRQGMI